MSWIEKILPKTNSNKKSNVPDGLWISCKSCNAPLFKEELIKQLNVCPKCDHHMQIGARDRLNAFLDTNARVEIGGELEPEDILKFKDSKKYKDRISTYQKATNEKDALVAIRGTTNGIPVIAIAFEFGFMGGSMGSVVGARFVKAAEECLKHDLPLVCFSASGGARMQEALMSLMQMAKTSAALAKMSEKGLPYISVLTNPTMGGVSASFAMLGDVHVAEPKAVIGFAGRRVIEQTVREKLPNDFQTSEFLKAKGAIDMIVHRRELKDKIAKLIAKFMNLPEADLN